MRSSILTALGAIAVVLAFTAVRGNRTSSSSSPPPPGASTTTSGPAHRLTIVPPTTSPAPPPTTAPATTATTAAPLAPCQPGDVRISTVTDAGAYAAGSSVTITTTLSAVRSCIFNPVAGGPYNCPSWIVVTDASDRQVWPWPGEAEQCSEPAATVLGAGDVETLRAAWNGYVATTAGTSVQAPPGYYSAIGAWSWSSGPGNPSVQTSRSNPFVES